MQTFSIQNIIQLDVPDDYQLLTPKDQPKSQPRGIARLVGALGFGGQHRRHVILGPEPIQIDIHAWNKDDTWSVPSIERRPLHNELYGPLGGAVKHRGRIKICGEEQPWIIRELPEDVSWDAKQQEAATMPCSYDVEVDFAADNKFVKIQCWLSSVDSTLVETYQPIVETVRPC